MANENDILSEADEIAALLPWYVSGKISDDDKARIEAYRRANPEIERQIVLAREEADLVFADNAAIHVPRDALSRLQESIASSPRARLHAVQHSIVDRMGLWLKGLAPRQLAYAGIAAAMVLLVQAVSIGSIVSNAPGNGGYQTASGPEASLAQGTFALVAFQPGAPTGTLSAFLAESGYSIAEGPKAGGVYRLRLSDVKMSRNDLDAAIAKLKVRSDLISFASAASQAQ
jgi:hypothetical protein